MYDISLSYMMYLPGSHSIPLTIILRSAFCVLRSAFCKIPLPFSLLHDYSTKSRNSASQTWVSSYWYRGKHGMVFVSFCIKLINHIAIQNKSHIT